MIFEIPTAQYSHEELGVIPLPKEYDLSLIEKKDSNRIEIDFKASTNEKLNLHSFGTLLGFPKNTKIENGKRAYIPIFHPFHTINVHCNFS
jgi:hypothetical protein